MLLKRLSREQGIILLTDSDRAGNFIRSKLKGILFARPGGEFLPQDKEAENNFVKSSSGGKNHANYRRKSQKAV